MKVLEVIPIARSTFLLDRLSYFSTKNAERGDLVKIDFRGKEIFAIVTKATNLKEEKAELKKIKSFKLKPIASHTKEKFLGEEWFGILDDLRENFFVQESSFLFSFLPKAVLSKNLESSRSTPERSGGQKLALKGSFDERIQYLKGVIRENFARRKSVLVIAPRIELLKKLHASLSRGVEEYSFLFSSELSAKNYLSLFNKATSENHPVLVIGTYQALFFDRPDLETIVIEEEGSRLWREHEGFHFDIRKLAEVISQNKRLNLIWSDLILRTETIYKAERGEVEARNILTGRIQSPVETRIIEAREKTQAGDKNENFSWITKSLGEEIEESLFREEKILLFVNRKGYSSFTLCQDCGTAQLCPNCSTPMVLHAKSEGERKFICHHCLKIESVPTLCQNCGSWKLKDFGLGIEKIEEEFSRLFPKSSNVVIATEKIFSEPDMIFDLVVIISLDYLLTIPDFRINETIFRLVQELKAKSRKKFILQTRLSENKLLSDAVSGNVSGFYQDEIKSRQEFGYPPFKKLIKLTREDKNLSLLELAEKKALEVLKEDSPISFPAFRQKTKNKYRRNILLKTEPAPKSGGRADEALFRKLHVLKNAWQISIDPDSVI